LASELYADYKTWCEDQGHDPKQIMSQKMFGTALSQRQVRTAGKDAKGKQFRGPIRLKTHDEIAADLARVNAGYQGFAPAAVRGPDPLAMDDDDAFGNGG
jgi:putative DNA primase/helicase